MDDGTLGMVWDILMVLAIAGLWVSWFFQAAQRKKVEHMLHDAAEDLKAATVLGDKVMRQLAAEGKDENQPNAGIPADQVAKRQAQDRVNLRASDTSPDKPSSSQDKKSKKAAMHATTVMRLHREGMGEEAIAAELGLPVAQVRLMLLLQTPKH